MNYETTSVTKKQIADLFRIHVNTVDGWIRAGLPHRKDGRIYLFDLGDTIAWHHQFVSSTPDDLPSRVEAQRRKEYYQSELKRLQFETAEGLLLNKERLIQIWHVLVGTMRTRLLSMPSKLTPMLFGCHGKPEIFVCLKTAVDEALNELSDERMYLTKGGKIKCKGRK